MTQYHNHCSEDVVRKGNEGIKSSDNIFYKNISSYFTLISALIEIDFFLLKKKTNKSTSFISIFPCFTPLFTYFYYLLQVLALVFVRKLMDFLFTKRELSWLDDLMPESKKKKLEDAEKEVSQSKISILQRK